MTLAYGPKETHMTDLYFKCDQVRAGRNPETGQELEENVSCCIEAQEWLERKSSDPAALRTREENQMQQPFHF